MKIVRRFSVLVVLVTLMLPLLLRSASLPLVAAQDGSPVAATSISVDETVNDTGECSDITDPSQIESDDNGTGSTCDSSIVAGDSEEASAPEEEDVTASELSAGTLRITIWAGPMEDDPPLTGATVVVRDADSNIVANGETGDDGVFTTEQLPGGDYSIDVSHLDYLAISGYYVQINGNTNQFISLIPQASPGTLTVTVLDELTGQFVQGATVDVRDADSNIVASGETGSDGALTTEQLQDGDYSIYVSHPGYLVQDGSIDVQINGDVDRSIFISPRLPGTMTISVTDETNGLPVVGAIVVVHDSVYYDTLASGETGVDGVFTSEQLPGGDYLIEVSHPNYFDQTVYAFGYGDSNKDVSLTPKTPGTLTITALDEPTEQPIEGVAIVIRDSSTFAIVVSGQTNSSGVFTTEQLPSGDYSIGMAHPDYLAGSSWVTVNGNTNQTVFLTPRVPGTLTITVSDDQTELPIPDVMVTVWDNGELLANGKTASDGAFTTEQLPSGDYYIELFHPDYFDKSDYAQVSSDTNRNISLTPRISGTLAITVLNEQTRQPIAGATVEVRDDDGSFELASFGETDSAGAFTTEQLPSGSYYASVSHPGYSGSTVWLTISGDVSSNITLTPVPTREPGTLTVTILNAHSNEPIEGSIVSVRHNEDLVAYGMTGSDGVFITDQLLGGDYYFSVSHAGYGQGFDSVSVDGNIGSTIFLIPQLPGALTITALDEQTAQPIEAVTVAVWDSGNLVAYGYTGTSGTFTTDQLPGGDYRVQLSHPGYLQGGNSVSVSGNTDHTISLTPTITQAPGTLRITVLDKSTQQPMAGALVVIHSWSENQVMVTGETGSDGVFTASEFTSDYYDIDVSYPGYFDFSFSDLVSGDMNETVKLVPRAPSTLAVTVRDQTTLDFIEHATVVVRDQNNDTIIASGETDSDGSFTTPQIPAGTYGIEVSASGYFNGQDPYISVDGTTQRTIRLVPRTPNTLTTITVRDDETLAPIENATVQIRDNKGFVLTGTTNSDGVFATNDLPGGSYTVQASHPDYFERDSYYRGISVQGTEKLTIQLQSRKAGTLSLRVLNEKTGQPVANATVAVTMFNDADFEVTGTTDSNGIFATDQLQGGNYYRIAVSSPLYLERDDQVFLNGDTGRIIQIAPSEPGRLTINLLDRETLAAIEGASVVVRNGNDDEIVASGETDSDGTFTTSEQLPGDNYKIVVSHPGYAGLDTSVQVNGDTRQAIQLVPGVVGQLKVNVLEHGSLAPVENATVMVHDSDTDEIVANGETGSDGVFVTGPLPRGSYHVTVTRSGYVDKVIDVGFIGLGSEFSVRSLDLFVQIKPTGEPIETPTATSTPTPTSTPTATPTTTPTASSTPTATPTSTPTATASSTPTATATATATIIPSSTPSSTPTATASGTSTATVASGGNPPGTTVRPTTRLNLRSGPGTRYSVRAVLPAGATCQTTGNPIASGSFTWYPVSCSGYGSGYVAGNYLNATAPPSTGGNPPGTTVRPTTRLNLRSGPGTGYSVRAVLPTSATCQTTGDPTTSGRYTWYPITCFGYGSGYVAGNFLNATTPPSTGGNPPGTTVHPTTRLNLRSGPGTGYSVRAVLPTSATCQTTGDPTTSGGNAWYPVNCGGYGSGFVAGKYLRS